MIPFIHLLFQAPVESVEYLESGLATVLRVGRCQYGSGYELVGFLLRRKGRVYLDGMPPPSSLSVEVLRCSTVGL